MCGDFKRFFFAVIQYSRHRNRRNLAQRKILDITDYSLT